VTPHNVRTAPGLSLVRLLLWVVDALAAAMLAADLAVVSSSVVARYVFDAPVEWADDVARGLLVALSFFGAAGAMARGETLGVSFFADRLPPRLRDITNALVAVLIVIVATNVAVHAFGMGILTIGQTTGSGLPLEWTFYPMGAGNACMVVFAVANLLRLRPVDVAAAITMLAALWVCSLVWTAQLPGVGVLMLVSFVLALVAGMPIGFALALSALMFIWWDGTLPGVIFAQQMARGIDNFVLLAIPFFMLTGTLMEESGIAARLIALLERLVGRVRGGLDVVMVLSMVLFSGISGSKMADVAAVGSVMIPAARRRQQDPGRAVALLAASAVMAETIPPCINLILLGFVANLSIGGLFMAGLLPAALMAAALIAVAVLFGAPRSSTVPNEASTASTAQVWGGAPLGLGLILIVFGGFKTGFATATEISAFAVLYALVAGGILLRKLSVRGAARSFVHAASRAGLVLYIVAAAQSLAFVLTLQQVPHMLAERMMTLSHDHGGWLFMIMSIAILVVMGSVLEGAAALIIFGPLLVPVAAQFGIAPLHYGVVLVIAMGIGLFAPPLGLGLYGACLIGEVPVETTVKPMLGYLGLLLACLIAIAFLPAITTWLPTALGYR
jgi:tripartite ATP-independent transporter DctM subunit